MKLPTRLAIKKPDFGDVAALVLTLSLVFLQEGISYYLSFQVLALVVVACLVFSAGSAMKLKTHFVIAYLAFSFCVVITAFVSPAVISANSSNIAVTVIGILGYSLMIALQPNLKMKRAGLILRVFRFVSSATIVILAALLFVSESGLIPSLDCDAMLAQNSRLIDNFTDADALSANAALDLLMKQVSRNDLFYGEPSFLAVVLFTCLGCFMFTSTLMVDAGVAGKEDIVNQNFKMYQAVMLTGIITLLYIQSFSSIIYALIAIYFCFVKGKVTRKRLFTSVSFLVVIGVAFMAFSYKYFLLRLTQSSDSLSMIQRFGFLVDISIIDLLLGVKEEALSPYGGIHNGLFYIIAISGLGGFSYLASLLYSMYLLSMPIKSYAFSVLLLMAIIMQNGGVFTPNKVVLISLLILPLACARSIYAR